MNAASVVFVTNHRQVIELHLALLPPWARSRVRA